MTIVEAGKLDHPMRLQRHKRERDEFNDWVDGWCDIVETIWTGVEPVSVRDFVNSNIEGTALTCAIIMRELPAGCNPLAADRLMSLLTGELYDIKGIIPVPSDNKLRCMCEVWQP